MIFEGLILGHLLNRQRRDYAVEEDQAETVMIFALLVIPTLLLCMPYLVYVAVRDYGSGRFWAYWSVALVLTLAAGVWVLGGLWWTVVMVLAVSIGAVSYIGWSARQLRLEEEREMGYGAPIS